MKILDNSLRSRLVMVVLALSILSPIKLHARDEILSFLKDNAVSIPDIEAIAPVLADADQKKLVLLGEASHGTSEYYVWRAKISKYLILEKGYDFIAVEADWPAAYEINRFVKNLPGAAATVEQAMTAFDRWPPWMWRNKETMDLITWLREYNMKKPLERRVGFYGVDLQDKPKSMASVLAILEMHDEEKYRFAKQNFECLTRHEHRRDYLRSVVASGQDCSDNMARVYEYVSARIEDISGLDTYEKFNLYHNLKLAVHAEQNLRASLDPGPDSWNVRARHFQYTAHALRGFYGGSDNNARGIIWAHNTHIGDARATGMAGSGMVNIGQLARQAYGRDRVTAIGFGTYSGEVLAASSWGGNQQRMRLPESPPDTWEFILNSLEHANFMIDLRGAPDVLKNEYIGHRAVGVTYNPMIDRQHYLPTRIADRYDAFIFFRQTHALNPL